MGESRRRTLPTLAPWTPFARGELDPTHLTLEYMRRQWGHQHSDEDIQAQLDEMKKDEIWINSRYQVNVRRRNAPEAPDLVWLSIKRRDKLAVGPERFRDFQRIKNELVGPECEGVEIYPAESRLVDTSNQYHIWVFDDPSFKYPFGFNERLIVGQSTGGAVQTPFEDD